MRRRAHLALAAAAAGAALACLSATAGAAPPPGPLLSCPELLQCGVVEVPLDHAAPASGTLRLVVSRLPARSGRPSRGALLYLSGGPGQAGIARQSADLMVRLRALSGNREIVALDVRGTGRSGALSCPALDGEAPAAELAAAAAACAGTIGPARRLYTTEEVVEDLDVVRRRLGIERWAVGGTSYGTYVAASYARAHPERVDRLLLDSLVPEAGDGADRADTVAAAPRVLGALAPGLEGDVRRLERILARRPVPGLAVSRAGVASAASLGGPREPGALLGALLLGDLDARARAAVPAAVRTALAGDATLLRRLAEPGGGGGPGQPTRLSTAAFLAARCADTPVPWTADTPPAGRVAALEAAAAAAAAGGPFTAASVASLSPVVPCVGWPEAGAARASAPLPDVPVLILSGEDDLRTPLEGARRFAAALPRAQVLTVPHRGHSVITGDDTCVDVGVRRFFAGRPVGRPCAGLAPSGPLLPQPPLSWAAFVATLPDGRPVTVALGALRATLSDLPRAAAAGGDPATGLRGGTADADLTPSFAIALRRYSYVPGVRVSGVLGFDFLEVRGRLAVTYPSGAATARFGPRGVSLKLPGRRPVRLPADALDAAAVLAST
jgi:pimeloyl-ACP methyl ester carboxylesterase